MQTRISKTLLTISALVVIAATATESMANIRIRFAKGETSATVKGRVATGGRVCYFVSGKAGQTLKASVTPTSTKSMMMIFESGETDYTYVLDVSGSPSVCVDNLGRAGAFSLTVSLE